MDNCFQFENRAVIIYGAAAIGLIAYDICKELDIPVLGFMDKRGDEISQIQGIRVYSTKSSEIETLDKESIIFVAVKNVFEHDNIVRGLIEQGFYNIIYRPYMVIKGVGSEKERIIYETYDKFIKKERIHNDIPKSFEVRQYEYKDYASIKRTESERVVYAPIESLFTDLKKRGNRKSSWLDIPIIALIPHIAFFRYMDQQEGFSYDIYIKFCIDAASTTGQIKTTDQWKRNVLNNRANIYNNMNEALETDFDFFIRNAPNAEWNADGYFNLVSGKHRAAFWVAKGRRYIPLKISNSDFLKWTNERKIMEIIGALKTADISYVNAPIEHPFFYSIQCENKYFYFRLLCDFIFCVAYEQYEKMGHVELDKLSTVFISLNDDGYISRILQKYGISVEVHNKSTLNMILENLIVVSREVRESSIYSYALVEFHYGEELAFKDVIERGIRKIICIISIEEIDEFKQAIAEKYAIVKRREAFKDGERCYIYLLQESCKG